MKTQRLLPMALVLSLVVLSTTDAAAESQYVGVDDCGRCHKKELVGDQLAVWKESQHSKAIETLKSEKAVRIAKEKGLSAPPHEADECLRCHATAHGLKEAQIYKKPLDISDGVQCESCHGPGSEWRGKTVHAESHEKAIAAGMWEPGEDEKICTTCHNNESPTFESFDYEERKKKIEHPIPEENKGRVLELEKAEREARRQG